MRQARPAFAEEFYFRQYLIHWWYQGPPLLMGVLLFAILWFFFLWHGVKSYRAAADFTGTLIFAFTGGLVCLRQFKQKNIWIATVALAIGGFLTAVAGGTIRTFALGLEPSKLFWLSEPVYLYASGLGLALAMLWEPSEGSCCESHWNAADRLALAVFVPLGAEKALSLEAKPIAIFFTAILFGFLTGAGGGLLRDILRMRRPAALFTPYGGVAALGAAFHISFCQIGIANTWTISGIVIYFAAHWAETIHFYLRCGQPDGGSRSRQKIYRVPSSSRVDASLNATAPTPVKTSDTDLSTVVSKAIKHYHANMLKKAVSSNVASNAKPVTSNVSSDRKAVSRYVPSNVSSNRYMTPALEDRIQALRQAGATSIEIASKLASEGYLNANGERYNTSTISKAERRSRVRTSTS